MGTRAAKRTPAPKPTKTPSESQANPTKPNPTNTRQGKSNDKSPNSHQHNVWLLGPQLPDRGTKPSHTQRPKPPKPAKRPKPLKPPKPAKPSKPPKPPKRPGPASKSWDAMWHSFSGVRRVPHCDIEKYTQSWAMILDRPRQPTTYTRTARSTHREPNRSGNPAATREHAHQLLLGRWECTSSWRQLESLQLCCQACWISIEGENGSKLTLPQK